MFHSAFCYKHRVTGCLLIFDGYDYNIYLAVVITVLLVLLFLSSIASLIIGCIKVEISKDGISTELFGKKLKFFKWEEVSEIKASVPDKDAYVSISFYREKNKKANKIKKEKNIFFILQLRYFERSFNKTLRPRFCYRKIE